MVPLCLAGYSFFIDALTSQGEDSTSSEAVLVPFTGFCHRDYYERFKWKQEQELMNWMKEEKNEKEEERIKTERRTNDKILPLAPCHTLTLNLPRRSAAPSDFLYTSLSTFSW